MTYKRSLPILAALALTACGGGDPAHIPEAATVQPAAKAARVLLVGGNELFTITPNLAGGLTYTPRDFGACANNQGVPNGDSVAILGLFQTGVLQPRPAAVYIVANAFELTYAERWYTLDNLTGAVLHATVTGAPVTLVGVPGQSQFNTELQAIAAAYGARYAETLAPVLCK